MLRHVAVAFLLVVAYVLGSVAAASVKAQTAELPFRVGDSIHLVQEPGSSGVGTCTVKSVRGAFIMCAEGVPNLWWNTASSSHVIIKTPAK